MKPPPQPQSTITCPVCKRVHGLFWKVHGPDKRELVYLCDQVKHLRSVKGKELKEYRTSTQTQFAPDGTVPADNLPEKLSRTWKKILQEQNQPRIAL